MWEWWNPGAALPAGPCVNGGITGVAGVVESPAWVAVSVQVPADKKETDAVPSALYVAEQVVPLPVVTARLGM